MSDASRAVIERAARAFEEEERYGGLARPGPRPWAVYALLALNIAGFIFQLARGEGTETDQSLIDAGAFYAKKIVVDHEWSRAFTYMVLHAGLFHLAMNQFALGLFGPFVERELKPARFVALYFLSGLAGSAVLLAFDWNLVNPDPAVGASGCIMGLVGATAALLLRGWLRDRAPIAGARLRLIGLTIVAQSSIDLYEKQISFKAHASGLVMGFLVALLFTIGRPKAAPSE